MRSDENMLDRWWFDMADLLVDENISERVVLALRAEGHDVKWIREAGRGTPDEQILEQAQDAKRIVLTFDKDFGTLIFQQGRQAASGVILLRPRSTTRNSVIPFTISALRQNYVWSGYLSVVEEGRIRRVPLPE